jgi:N,N'-diacetylchitobiose phosphorylase
MTTAHVLSNGRYAALLSPRGGGYSALDGFALTRWVPDPSRDVAAIMIYIRDVGTGAFCTIGSGTAAAAVPSTAVFSASTAEFAAELDGIAARLHVCIDATHDAELRRLTLRNTGTLARELEITTYAELSLNTPAADAAHPAFSRLFVQTAHDAAHHALLAWRRPRSPDDRPLWVAHGLLDDHSSTGPLTFETDRMRFVGRGRDAFDPAAMHGPLCGTVGNVLDPVFALRRIVRVEAGATSELVAILTAASSREIVLRTLAAFPHTASATACYSGALPAQRDAAAGLGLPQRWRETLELQVGTVAEYALPAHGARNAGTPISADSPSTPIQQRSHAAPAPPRRVTPTQSADHDADVASGDALQCFNGIGGFSADGTEYVIRMPLEHGALRRPPLPWVNVMANEEAGCIVSESGATYTWSANSRENRVTPWFNDPVCDPHGEALYVREEEGRVWSPLPGPSPARAPFEVRHGFGYSRFAQQSDGIASDTTIFVPADAPVRIARVELHNTGTRRRALTLFSYAQLVLGAHEADTRGRVETWHDGNALFARNPHRGEFSQRVAFAGAAAPADSARGWTTDRAEFIGVGGNVAYPAAVAAASLRGAAGASLDPCFALSRTVTLEPGATVVCSFLLGEAADEGEAAAVVARFADSSAVDVALRAVRAAWAERVSAIHIATPSPAIDLMVNGWLVYQNLSCRMWARSAFYQSGGAFGFRDQLQDSSALLYIDPALTRAQILLHAAHQFVEGDVLHWWHPPLSKGIRTRFSDDLLWLPYITAFYIGATGDADILREQLRYLTARPLEPGEDEEFLVPEDSGRVGTLYEHCCLTIDRSLTRGVHGLPLMGTGDWNDGMNRVGREGKGESVWLGFFLYDILGSFIPLCDAAGDSARVATYTVHREQLGRALNEGGWDGAWYRRAFYDNGAPLGSAASDECRIDALAQAWAVLSGAAPADRAVQALDALEDHLVSEDEGLIRLLAPPFDRTPNDPGYIKGYLPGVRENGGQYTHGVLWSVRALAEAGRCERAAPLLEMLSPVTRGGADNVHRYMVEPFVIAADVYGVAPHVGRGGWTWYTGSAGWMYRIALESILGLQLHEGREIRLKPCIPLDWTGFSLRYRRVDGTVYDIEVARGDWAGMMDGRALKVSDGAVIVPLLADGATHAVRLTIPRT